MRGRDSFKTQIISAQSPQRRRSKTSQSRNRIDLMKLHGSIVSVRAQRKAIRFTRTKRFFFALIAIPCFFLLGYLIAALSVPMWAKVILFTPVAVLGFVMALEYVDRNSFISLILKSTGGGK